MNKSIRDYIKIKIPMLILISILLISISISVYINRPLYENMAILNKDGKGKDDGEDGRDGGVDGSNENAYSSQMFEILQKIVRNDPTCSNNTGEGEKIIKIIEKIVYEKIKQYEEKVMEDAKNAGTEIDTQTSDNLESVKNYNPYGQ